jgi:serine protease
VVAVVDTGIDWRHPDLQSAIWINAGEDLDGDGRATSGDLNGVDDDGNGYVDDIIGWDFVQDDNDPMDTYGHGTSVSGVVTAATGNGVGVAGHTWNCPIMPIRVRSTLATDYRRVAQGIRYAVENGARVVNLSLGGLQPPDPSLKDAIAAAYGAGVLIVGSAGNQDSDRLHYPDAYDEVMSVAAVDAAGTKTTSSNYGETVEVSAQTGNMTTTLGGGYDSAGGTSHATPCVSALGALLFSHSPQLTNDEVRDIIGATADSVDTMNPEHVGLLGAGRINFLAALESGG